MKVPVDRELIVRAAEFAGLGKGLSRRRFLWLAGSAVTSLAILSAGGSWGADTPLVIIDNARGLVLADPTRCVGCLRCELACTEFNDGRAQPGLARIKISRNLSFGRHGPVGGPSMEGDWGNGLSVQDTCRQCPHPVPCATACPENAIRADSETGARVIDASSCVGCRLCQRACPWDMISFDEETQKATKCFLCHGSPKCVEACPSGALNYVPWRNIIREPRVAPLSVVPPEKAAGCLECHTK